MNTRSSKIRLNVLIIVLTLLAVSLACDTGSTGNGLNVETQVALTLAAMNPEPIETTAPTTCTTVEFNGISFCYDPLIAQGTSTSIDPAISSPDDPWFSMPQIEQIDFDGYVTGEKFHSPRIMVFSVSEYQSVNENASATISELQQYIANKPNIPADAIPFLPRLECCPTFQGHSGICQFPKWTGHPLPGGVWAVFGSGEQYRPVLHLPGYHQ